MIKINGKLVKSFKFSAGEVNPTLPEGIKAGPMEIIAWLQSSDDILELLLVCNSINNQYGPVMKTILIPYYPYSRQDRVCSLGEAKGFEVATDLLQNLGQVVTFDLHNPDVKPYMLKNISLLKILKEQEFEMLDSTILVAPDHGATSKVKEVAEYFNVPWIQGLKKRDPSTGELSGFDVDTSNYRGTFEDKNLLILDDICDGGGTFIGLADVINDVLNPESLDLYVTHGIFSKGLKDLWECFDDIITTDTFISEYDEKDGLEVLRIVEQE